MDDWTYEETIGAPALIKIEFVDQQGQPQTASLVSTTWSSTTTAYTTAIYYDNNGKQQSQDVAVKRFSSTRSTAAAVNGAYVKWRLEKGLELPPGDAMKESTTTYAYEIWSDGPRLVEEVTKESISEFELAGSLNISDYTGFEPTSALLPSSETINIYQQGTGINGRPFTKNSTSRYLAQGLTQEGQQSASKQLAGDPGDGSITEKVFISMVELIFDGTEVRNTIGRAPVPGRPSGTALLAEQYLNPYDPGSSGYGGGGYYDSSGNYIGEGLYDGTGDVGVEFDYDGDGLVPDAREYAYETLPYTPDFYTDPSYPPGSYDSILDLPLSGRAAAEQAAREYAIAVNSLRAGYAYGFNITTSANRLPAAPFAPLFVNAAGLSITTRINGTSWAFDASGMVASADLLLSGVAGTTEAVSSSWVRLPVSVNSLPVLSAPTESLAPAPASTISVPDGFDPLEPAGIFSSLPTTDTETPIASQTVSSVVAPYLLVEPLVARSRHRMAVIELGYEVTSSDVIELRSRHQVVMEVGLFIDVPALSVTGQGLAPAVVIDGAIQPPALAVSASTLAPVVSTGATVRVPATSVTAITLEPTAPREVLAVAVPAAPATAAALAPAVSLGAAVTVPAAAVNAAALEPRSGGNLGDNYGLTAMTEDDLLELL